jgi:5-formyltetrahydrofolate cyclo-ligase
MNERKRALRTELAAARARLSADDRAARSAVIADRILEVPGFRDAHLLAVYAPLGAEVDPGELARRAAARGATVLYPRAHTADRRLTFAPARAGELVRGPLGALEPPATAPEISPDRIDAVVVPCLGFSADGHRLGRGGGYYDATLPTLGRALRIGVAFEVQLVPALPREPHDAPLDAIVTEERVLLFHRRCEPGASPS